MSLSDFHLPLQQIRTATLGWLLFLGCASIYCVAYNQMVLLNADSFIHSFLWSLKEYAHWLLLTPLLLMLLHKFSRNPALKSPWCFLKVAMCILSIALLLRVAIGIYSNPHSTFISNLIYFFPNQLSTLAIIIMVWKLSQVTSIKKVNEPRKPAEDSVLVMKGSSEKLIRWDSVNFINAAGNYLELVCDHEQYLLRATMKQLEAQLPEGKFIRIHRSYIVNLARVERITSQPAGNGLVILCNGQQLPLSKSYKKSIKSYKLMIN